MLRILVVEDDSQLAITLKYLVEDNPRYRVIAMAEDADGAIAAAEEHDPDLVLLDLHLAHGTTGFSVAVRLNPLTYGLAGLRRAMYWNDSTVANAPNLPGMTSCVIVSVAFAIVLFLLASAIARKTTAADLQ